MKLSVAIPTYKRPDALKRNLEALLQSGMPCFEVIVSDDGGDNATLAVVKEFSLKLPIKYIPPQGKGSLAINISRLIETVSGDWTFLIHDDDFVTGDHSLYLQNYADHYDFIFSDHWLSDDNGIIDKEKSIENSKRYHRSVLSKGLQRDGYKLVLDHTVCLDGFYIRTNFLKKFKPQPKFGSVADYYWILQILTSDIRIGYLKERTFAYTLSTEGLTNTGLNEDIVKIYRHLITEDSDVNHVEVYKYRLSLNTWFAVNSCIRKGEKRKAFDLLKSINFNYTHSLKHKILMPVQLAWLLFRRGT